ncbi:hypothetical protein Tco_0966355 [Tanacetum coccineum]
MNAMEGTCPTAMYGKICKSTRDKILKDHWKEKFGEEDDDTDKGWEDPEKCGEEKIDAILDTVFDKLGDSWFSGEPQDEDDLDGITNYLEPTSYDGFIDSEDKAYKERLCNFLGMPYRKPPPILIKRVEVTRYNIGPGETYTKTKILGIDKIPRTSTNVANVCAVLMDELGADKSSKEATIKSLLDAVWITTAHVCVNAAQLELIQEDLKGVRNAYLLGETDGGEFGVGGVVGMRWLGGTGGGLVWVDAGVRRREECDGRGVWTQEGTRWVYRGKDFMVSRGDGDSRWGFFRSRHVVYVLRHFSQWTYFLGRRGVGGPVGVVQWNEVGKGVVSKIGEFGGDLGSELFGDRGGELPLPENWYNDFCGFLIFAVLVDHVNMRGYTSITINKEVSDDMRGMFHDVVWGESFGGKRIRVLYVSFASLRCTEWWNPTHKNVSFYIHHYNTKPSNYLGIGASLVPMNNGSGLTDTSTDSSEFTDDYTHKISISRDSKSSLTISPSVY